VLRLRFEMRFSVQTTLALPAPAVLVAEVQATAIISTVGLPATYEGKATVD
jgi:hypothetical protein